MATTPQNVKDDLRDLDKLPIPILKIDIGVNSAKYIYISSIDLETTPTGTNLSQMAPILGILEKVGGVSSQFDLTTHGLVVSSMNFTVFNEGMTRVTDFDSTDGVHLNKGFVNDDKLTDINTPRHVVDGYQIDKRSFVGGEVTLYYATQSSYVEGKIDFEKCALMSKMFIKEYIFDDKVVTFNCRSSFSEKLKMKTCVKKYEETFNASGIGEFDIGSEGHFSSTIGRPIPIKLGAKTLTQANLYRGNRARLFFNLSDKDLTTVEPDPLEVYTRRGDMVYKLIHQITDVLELDPDTGETLAGVDGYDYDQMEIHPDDPQSLAMILRHNNWVGNVMSPNPTLAGINAMQVTTLKPERPEIYINSDTQDEENPYKLFQIKAEWYIDGVIETYSDLMTETSDKEYAGTTLLDPPDESDYGDMQFLMNGNTEEFTRFDNGLSSLMDTPVENWYASEQGQIGSDGWVSYNNPDASTGYAPLLTHFMFIHLRPLQMKHSLTSNSGIKRRYYLKTKLHFKKSMHQMELNSNNVWGFPLDSEWRPTAQSQFIGLYRDVNTQPMPTQEADETDSDFAIRLAIAEKEFGTGEPLFMKTCFSDVNLLGDAVTTNSDIIIIDVQDDIIKQDTAESKDVYLVSFLNGTSNNSGTYAHPRVMNSAKLDFYHHEVTQTFNIDGLRDDQNLCVSCSGHDMSDLLDVFPLASIFKTKCTTAVAWLWKKFMSMDSMGFNDTEVDGVLSFEKYSINNPRLIPEVFGATLKTSKTLAENTLDLLKDTNAFPMVYNDEGVEKFAVFVIKDTFVGNEMDYNFSAIDPDFLQLKVSLSSLHRVATKVKVNYGGDDFALYGKTTHSTESRDVSELFPDYSLNFYGIDDDASRETTLECPYIVNETDANNYRDWYLKHNCQQKIIIQMTLPMKYIDTHLGAILWFEELPYDMRILGIDFNLAWYGGHSDPTHEHFDNGDHDDDDDGETHLSDEQINELSINGQFFLPYFVVTKHEVTPNDIRITCEMLMHLDTEHPPTACHQAVRCYVDPENPINYFGCTVPLADNYSSMANVSQNEVCTYSSVAHNIPPAYLGDAGLMKAGWIDVRLNQGKWLVPFDDNLNEPIDPMSMWINYTGTAEDSGLNDDISPPNMTSVGDVHKNEFRRMASFPYLLLNGDQYIAGGWQFTNHRIPLWQFNYANQDVQWVNIGDGDWELTSDVAVDGVIYYSVCDPESAGLDNRPEHAGTQRDARMVFGENFDTHGVSQTSEPYLRNSLLVVVQKRTSTNPFMSTNTLDNMIGFASVEFGFRSHWDRGIVTTTNQSHDNTTGDKGNGQHLNIVRIWNLSDKPIPIDLFTSMYTKITDSNTDPSDYFHEPLLGDVNLDSAVNVLDVVLIALFILGWETDNDWTEEALINADFNQNGDIDVLDVIGVRNFALDG